MGLIKAVVGSVGGTLADQWKEFFHCESLPNDVLITKGEKRIGRRSSNTKANDNVISNGSGIIVSDGQCMIIVEQGKVVEVCSEVGEYTYDNTIEPSIFAGDGIKETFKNIGKRFTYGGEPAKDQRVYYLNTKELLDNKFGTPNPIPFRVVDNNIGLDIDVGLRASGVYSYKIDNPILFYTNVSGNVSTSYSKSELDSQLKTEFISALQPALAKISTLGVRPNQLPGYVEELSSAMNDVLSNKWNELRGLKIVSIGLNPITLTEKDAQLIQNAQHAGILRDPSMAGATIAQAQAEAMKAAASNEGGALSGFMGMQMAQQSGSSTADLLAMGKKEESKDTWICQCGHKNTGKFCSNCGKEHISENTWTCECGHNNTGKFCSNCGKSQPAKTICSNCGFVDKTNTNHKFCPQCGNKLSE